MKTRGKQKELPPEKTNKTGTERSRNFWKKLSLEREINKAWRLTNKNKDQEKKF